MNLKKIFAGVFALIIIVAFNNCNRFSTLDQKGSLSALESASDSPDGNDNPTQIPMPLPAPTPTMPQPTPAPQTNNGKAWPNEPSGLSLINDCAWSSLCSGWEDFYNTMSIPGGGIQPGNGPLSPPSSFKYIMFPNASSGGTQLDIRFSPVRRIFIGATIKNNADFVGYANGNNKIFLIRNDETPSVLELFTNLADVGTAPPKWVSGRVGYNNQNGGVLNNCHLPSAVGDCPGGVNMFPNVASGSWTRGVYHKIEMELQSSTTNSSRDGVIRIWLDGTLILSHTNANTGQSAWSSISITPTWDGQGAASCWNGSTNPYGRDCSKQWEWEIDHFHISGSVNR